MRWWSVMRGDEVMEGDEDGGTRYGRLRGWFGRGCGGSEYGPPG